MARKKPKHIEFKQQIPIQLEIMKYHPELPLHIDFFYINGHPYFTTIAGKLNFRTIKRCRGRGRKDILNILQAVVAWNTTMGYQIYEYHSDNEFKNIEANIIPSTLHTQAAGDHEPMEVQNIRTLKDRNTSIFHSVPYRKIQVLVIESTSEQA